MNNIIVALGFLIIVGGFVLAYFGVFNRVSVDIQEAGGGTVIFQDVKGDYRQTGIVMDEIYYELKNAYGVETSRGYGKYYDNPKEVAVGNLRSEAGVFLEKEHQKFLVDLRKNFDLKTIDHKEYVVAEFPFRNRFSVMFSTMKVYPALEKFCEANELDSNTPVIEITDVGNSRTIYLKEIKKK